MAVSPELKELFQFCFHLWIVKRNAFGIDFIKISKKSSPEPLQGAKITKIIFSILARHFEIMTSSSKILRLTWLFYDTIHGLQNKTAAMKTRDYSKFLCLFTRSTIVLKNVIKFYICLIIIMAIKTFSMEWNHVKNFE